jgi:hypothetical protein
MKNKKVYLVLTQTYSGVARTIKAITKKKYSHASLSLDRKCNKMYSFGRKYKYIPFYGVFKKEDLNKGLFKNKNACIAIYEIDVTEEQYNGIVEKIKRIKEKNRGYNIIGLLSAYFRVKLYRNKYYCSEFVYEVLSSSKVGVFDKNKVRFQPEELVEKNFKKIFEGTIKDLLEYK